MRRRKRIIQAVCDTKLELLNVEEHESIIIQTLFTINNFQERLKQESNLILPKDWL